MEARCGASARVLDDAQAMRWLLRTVRVDVGLPRRYFVGDLILFGLWAAMVIAAIRLTPDPTGHGTHRQLGLPP
jgi:hypothetical protein